MCNYLCQIGWVLIELNTLSFTGVQKACCDFLEEQLDPSNCLGIKAFAETHGCEELRKAAEKYILKHFVELVDSEEFLQLDNEDLVSLIKCDNLTVSYLYCTNWTQCDSNPCQLNPVNQLEKIINFFKILVIYLLQFYHLFINL